MLTNRLLCSLTQGQLNSLLLSPNDSVIGPIIQAKLLDRPHSQDWIYMLPLILRVPSHSLDMKAQAQGNQDGTQEKYAHCKNQ